MMGSGPSEPCASLLGISWRASDENMAVECHVNPSVSTYMEIDLKTGRHIRDLAGFGFTPSPDAKWVAHVAPMMHFAPAWAKSYFLQLDDLTVYPFPNDIKPHRQTGPDEFIEIVKHEDDNYSGWHSFLYPTPAYFYAVNLRQQALLARCPKSQHESTGPRVPASGSPKMKLPT